MTSASTGHAANTLSQTLRAIVFRSSLKSTALAPDRCIQRRRGSPAHDGKNVFCLLAPVHTVSYDFVESRGTISGNHRQDLTGSSAGAMPLDHIVGYQRIKSAPVFLSEGERQRCLIEPAAGEFEIACVVLSAQHVTQTSTQSVVGNASVVTDRAKHQRRLLDLAPCEFLAATNLTQRPVDERRRCAGADNDAVGFFTGELQHLRPRCREPKRHRPRAHGEAPPGDTKSLALV